MLILEANKYLYDYLVDKESPFSKAYPISDEVVKFFVSEIAVVHPGSNLINIFDETGNVMYLALSTVHSVNKIMEINQ